MLFQFSLRTRCSNPNSSRPGSCCAEATKAQAGTMTVSTKARGNTERTTLADSPRRSRQPLHKHVEERPYVHLPGYLGGRRTILHPVGRCEHGQAVRVRTRGLHRHSAKLCLDETR